MGRAITLTDVAQTNVISGLDVTMYVELSSMERPIIEVEKLLRHDRINDTWVAITTKRKFLVEGLSYSYDENSGWKFMASKYPTKDVFRLTGIRGRYFTANNKIGLSVDVINNITDEMVNAIPDKLHEYAKQELANVMSKKLKRILDMGVVVEGEINA